jgi:hypothetical protein
MTFRRIVRLGTLAFVLHNAEEALTMPTWLESEFPTAIRRLGLPPFEPPTTERLYRGLIMVTVVPVVAVLLGSHAGPGSLGIYVCLIVYGIFFWNALLPHLTAAVLLGIYNPGLATAALVNIPYTVHLFGRALREGQATPAGIAFALGLAAICYSLGMLLLWAPWVSAPTLVESVHALLQVNNPWLGFTVEYRVSA